MGSYQAKGPYSNRHHEDREALRRTRAPRIRRTPPPPPSGYAWTAQQKLVLGVILTVASGWAATVAAKAWGMAVPAAFLLLVGGLMALAGSVWKSLLVWEEMPYGHGGGLYRYYFFPFRILQALVIFTNFERFKAPLLLIAKGLGVMFLGYLLDSMLSGPSA